MGERLNTLYTQILNYCSMAPNAAGEVERYFVFEKSDRKPMHIGGKLLLMPTDKNLRRTDIDQTTIFHPLQELTNRGESDIVKALRHQLNVSINYTTLKLIPELIGLVANTAYHKEFSPEQRELLLEVPEVTSGLALRFVKLVEDRYIQAPTRYFTNIYLKKAGKFQNQTHSRVGIVQFPFYEDLKDPGKLKKGDVEVLEAVFSFLFPGSKDDPEAYNSFSDNREAPWLDCLLRTSANLTQRLNEVMLMYKPYLNLDVDNCLFNHDWMDGMDNIESYRGEVIRIPVQSSSEVSPETPAVPAAKPVQVAEPVNDASGQYLTPMRRQPVQVPQPTQAVQQVQPPVQPMQPVQPQYMVDQFGRPVAVYPAAPQPAPTGPAAPAYTPDGKLDFRAVAGSSPAVMAAAPMAAMAMAGWAPSNLPGMAPGFAPMVDPRVAPVGMPQFTGGTPAAPMGYYQQMQQQQQYYQQAPYGGVVLPGV